MRLHALRLIAVALVAVVAGLWSMQANRERIVEGTDATQYDHLARNLASGHGFSGDGPPFGPTAYREPGYPLFVAAIYRLVGPGEDRKTSPVALDLVALVQVGLFAATAVLAASVAGRLFGATPGFLAGVLFAVGPEVANYAHWLLSETLFGFLLLLAVALALRARRSGGALDHVAFGVALGLAAMVRAIAGTVALPIIVLLVLCGERGGFKLRVLRATLVVLGLLISVGPWVVRNWEAFDRPSLTSRSGVVLLRRAPRAAEPWSNYPGYLTAAAWIATNPVSNFFVPLSSFQWGPQPEENLIWDFHVNDSVRYSNRFDSVCQAAVDYDSCAGDVGVGFVKAYPVQYAVLTLFELVKLQFAPLPSNAATVHNLTVWLGWLGALALAAGRRLRRAHVFVLGIAAINLGTSALVDTQVRYSVPLLPLYAACAAGGVGWLAASGWAVRTGAGGPARSPRADPLQPGTA